MRTEQELEYIEYVRARSVTLRRLAYRLCGDWHTAEDVVQKAFVLLYRHWRRANQAASLDAYVRRMVVNAYLEDRRGWWARQVTTVADLPAQAQPDQGADGRLDLLAALARISPGQRAVLVLRYWEQLDIAETAETLGCSAGTVKSQTSLAIAALRRLMPDYVRSGREERQ
ncbi:SigE family RNA polymerase sigma factor [Luedemannella flava]|uniref:SigE family RNA polymerase sigma factor n=1 Tax=Luedemannella flava TaxID=349316 RepID=A0ABP4Y026_9ACTN